LEKHLKGIDRKVLNLAFILIRDGKFSLIRDVYSGFQMLVDDQRGIEKAEIITAIPLDENERAGMAERLGEITGKKIILTEKIDPNIIGGIIVRVGGKILDGSTRTRLAALRNDLINMGS